jgi:hypothetical protein
VSSTSGICGIDFGGGIGRGFSTLSHRDALHVTCPILLRRDGALHPFVVRSFSTLFSITALSRFNTYAFCALGGPIFGNSTLGGNQWDPGHVNPVALLQTKAEADPQWDGEPEGAPQHVPGDEALSTRQQKNTIMSSQIESD